MIGDAGSDLLYTGDVSSSVFSLDYVRTKAGEFQSMLNDLDAAYQAANNILASGALDPDSVAEIQASLDEFDSKRFLLRTTAEGFNLGAATINSLGGRMPVLSVPATLGLAPLVVPAALIAAVATAGALVTWGVIWLNGLNERLARAQIFDALPESDRAEVARSMAIVDNAAKAADSSPLATVASMVKWGVFAFLAFLAYRAFSRVERG